jgi:hypothetical protein
MQNKLNLNIATSPGAPPAEALRVCAQTGLAQRDLPVGEAEVQRMVKTLLRLQPAALSAIAATANMAAAEPSPADMSQSFTHALKTLAA